MYFQTGQVFFVIEWPNGEFVSILCWQHSGWQNTLCNGCILNRFIGFIQSLQVIWTMLVSSHVTGHKFLEDVYEDSMQFSSQINRFLCNRPNGPLMASGRPVVSKSFSFEDVRTSEQHHLDARSKYFKFYMELDFSRHCLESFCKTSRWRGNTSGHYPTFQNIPGFSLRTQKGVTVKTVRTLG